MFNAVVVRKSASNVSYKVETVDESYLSKGDVLVKVLYSSINYKDMLALQYNGGVIRDYPMIPGIDFAGIVESSSNDKFKEGDNVLVTGYDVGVTHTGGFSEYAQVPGEWIVPVTVDNKQQFSFTISTNKKTVTVQELDYKVRNWLTNNKKLYEFDGSAYETGYIKFIEENKDSFWYDLFPKKDLVPFIPYKFVNIYGDNKTIDASSVKIEVHLTTT